MRVIILVDPELGWDNVVQVAEDTPENLKNAEYLKRNKGYIVTQWTVTSEIDPDDYI